MEWRLLIIQSGLGCGLYDRRNQLAHLHDILFYTTRLFLRANHACGIGCWVGGITGRLVVGKQNRYTCLPFGRAVCFTFPPLYMPFAWGVVLIQTAYVGWRSLELFGLRTAVLFTGMLGAGTIPFYEWWAKGAGWWYYRLTPMWGAISFYIILGEFLIASGLILVVNRMKERPSWMVSLFGIAQGLWIWGCYIIAFVLIG